HQITTVGTDGAYVVTCRGENSEGYDRIFGQCFNADGTTAAITQPDARLDSHESPAITALGDDGTVVVTWRGVDSDDDYSIFVQRFNADGTTRGALVTLEAIGRDNYDEWVGQVTAVGDQGAFVVTWMGRDSGKDE